MSTANKLLQAASGAAGAGDPVFVEDLFSPYIYTGTNPNSQDITNGIALGSRYSGSSTSFDTVDDYLVRTSDLSGNSDSKTFTLSVWVYNTDPEDYATLYDFSSSNNRINLNPTELEFVLYNSSGSKIIDQNISYNFNALQNQWVHILLSIDINAGAGQLYVNDTAVSWSVSISNNSAVDFTGSHHAINGPSDSYHYVAKKRLAHWYIDRTYRNLGTESNRRLFIDSNGGAVTGLESLSPIVYLPLTSDYAIGKNLGTGGDFTVVGDPVIDTTTGPVYDAAAGKGGMVWLRSTDSSSGEGLYDTERGVRKYLTPYSANSQTTATAGKGITHFNASGFTLGQNYNTENYSDYPYISWTWRKQEKFFDVVKYNGNGSAGNQIAHNLGSVPGMIWVKRTGSTKDWWVYHVGANGGTNPQNKYAVLNENDAEVDSTTAWNDTAPTATHFTVGSSTNVNASGEEHIAYLFANNEAVFGENSDEAIIRCGTFTPDGSGNFDVNVGFEPQWVMYKRTDSGSSGDWYVVDSKRKWVHFDADSLAVQANRSTAPVSQNITPSPEGFKGTSLTANAKYSYCAIRAPQRVPTKGTDVFQVTTQSPLTSISESPAFDAKMKIDWAIQTLTNSGQPRYSFARLIMDRALQTDSNGSSSNIAAADFNYNEGFYNSTTINSNSIAWMFKKGRKVFDVVTYKGSNSDYTHKHGLTVVPEMMWVKNIDGAETPWQVYHSALGADYKLELNSTSNSTSTNAWDNASDVGTAPTATEFTVKAANVVTNHASYNYIAFLFATLAGVSKVGSYVGNGSTQNIDCGFTNGARFVLLKRSSANSGDWILVDTKRGIVAGDDPMMPLNDQSIQDTTTDIVDPYSAGFALTSETKGNQNGTTYIFLAFA